MNSTLKPCEADPIGMTFVLHSARVASLIVLCLLLTSEDAAVYYWEWEKGSVDAGRPLDSAEVILHARGQNSEVLFLLTFFLWPLVASVPHFLSGLSLLSLWIL